MSFEVETTYDKPTVQAFQRILNRTVRYKRLCAVRIITIVIGCVSIAYGCLWLWAKAAMDASLVPAISGFIAGAVFLLIGIFYEAYLNKFSRHMVEKTPVTIRYSFDKHGYSTITGKQSVRSIYGILHNIYEGEGHFVLMLDRRRGFVLDKSRFLTGDPEEFRRFVEERTGKAVQAAR